MSKSIERWVFRVLTALMLCMVVASFGCSGNSNEAEFGRTAPPGIPSEHPNESVADRRARTRIVSKQEQKIEARNKAIAEKKAAEKNPEAK
jgi:hypothetical protein